MADKKQNNEIVEEKYPTFANAIKDIKTVDELDKSLVVFLRQKEDLTIQKARDPELIKLKAKKAELSKPYTQTIGALKKMQGCIYMFGNKFEAELKAEFEKNLVAYARQLSAIKREKAADNDLNILTEAITDINEDYNPTIKQLELKCEYIAWFIKERFDVDEPKVEI